MFHVHLPELFEKGPVGVLKGLMRVWEPVAFIESGAGGEHACAATCVGDSRVKTQSERSKKVLYCFMLLSQE